MTADCGRLWLKCGKCNDATLARLSTDVKLLPGEPFGVERWPGGEWKARPAWDRDGWTHEFRARTPGRATRSAGSVARWWSGFVTSGKRRDDWYIGRDG